MSCSKTEEWTNNRGGPDSGDPGIHPKSVQRMPGCPHASGEFDKRGPGKDDLYRIDDIMGYKGEMEMPAIEIQQN